MTDLVTLGKYAKEAAAKMAVLETEKKNEGLLKVAAALEVYREDILKENQKDVETAKKNQMKSSLVDRLVLTEERILDMADGLRKIASLDDPIGEVISMKKRPNGLMIGQKRVPLGVIGIIYEARPNVTTDAFGLCFKTGNVAFLKGGKDAFYSNKEITRIIKTTLEQERLPQNAILFLEDTDRNITKEFMRLHSYIDVLIPRGSAGLIQSVIENSTIPVIETGTGNCHVYVDETADFQMALDIIENAKTQRIGVCNACESIVLHRNIASAFLPKLCEMLKKKKVEIRGDEETVKIVDFIIPAQEEDWGMEYLDYIVSVKIVNIFDEAITHINHYNTGHSETIITKDYENAERFLNEIDAACVYVNASTRFTDGFEFGFGAEIGISTQKLHARGPMGLNELTSLKYIIYGNGQIRK